jgi:diadenylate cyclase
MAPWSRVSFTVLDILLVALIIYEVLVMIRGTRAAPMLAGLAAVAVAFYLARIGELVTLNWLVSHLVPYVVFALIVVFQAEIRHVLSDVGRRSAFCAGRRWREIRTTTSCWRRIYFRSIRRAH